MNEEILNSGTTGLNVNERMKEDLLSAAKWAKFLCIVGCVGVGFLVILGLVMVVLGSVALPGMVSNSIPGIFLGFLYFIVAAIYIYPLIKGFQFANATKAACLSNDERELARGFEGLSSLLKFCGILTIICIVIYVIFFLGMGMIAMLR
jgi:hypothetical protein